MFTPWHTHFPCAGSELTFLRRAKSQSQFSTQVQTHCYSGSAWILQENLNLSPHPNYRWFSKYITLYPLEIMCNCLQGSYVHKQLSFMYFHYLGSSFLQSSLVFCMLLRKDLGFSEAFQFSVSHNSSDQPSDGEIQLYREFIRQILTGVTYF